jgi:hypothetical protein
MNPRRLYFAKGFDKAFRNLTPDLQRQVRQAILHFRERSAEHALRPERKSGLQGIWAFRVTRGLRVFYFQKRDAQGTYSELIHVGPHDDYRTIGRR